jgi:methionyl-tRNA formyltransferase
VTLIPSAPWRVAIVTRILPVALGFQWAVREAGHEPVALLTIRDGGRRYGPDGGVGAMVDHVPAELDVLLAARRESIAPLLASVRPDLVVCTGFPWKIPPDALAVPPLGWLNGHPSLLPRHRGPVPVAWAIREGDEEVGVTVHRMDAGLDTGAVMAQRSFPLGEYVEPDEFYGRLGPILLEALGEALGKLAAGDEGTAQEGGDYESFFGLDDLHLDLSRPALEVHRLVWAWRYTFPVGGMQGALVTLDGETVRVLASSLVDVEGATRIECGDGPLWLVQTEPVSEAATSAIAPAPSTH